MATMPPELMKDCLTDLCIREMHKTRTTFMSLFMPPKKPSRYDGRGVYRGLPPTDEINWFKYLTPLGRLKALNRRARMKRQGMGTINITYSRQFTYR